MPDIVDDGPKLAEIFRNLLDFRSEFRHAMDNVVRKDVYVADARAVEFKMEAQQAEIKRLVGVIDADQAERKMLRNTMLGSVLAAVTSLVIAVIK